MAETSSDTNVSEVTVTGQRAPKTHFSLMDAALTTGEFIVDPASTTREKTSHIFAKAAGHGGNIDGEFAKKAVKIGDRMDDRVETETPKPVSSVVSVVSKVTGLDVIVDPARAIFRSNENAGTASVDVGKNIGTDMGDRLTSIPGVGQLAGAVVGASTGALDAQEKIDEMKRGINLLSDKGVPGFECQTAVINGQTITVWVSAADRIDNIHSKPWVHIEKGEKNNPGNPVRATEATLVQEFANEVSDKATGDIDDLKMNMAEANADKAERLKTGSDELDKKAEELSIRTGISEDGTFPSPEAEQTYNDEFDKLTAQKAKLTQETTQGSARQDLKTQIDQVYKDVDASKRPPAPQPQMAAQPTPTGIAPTT